MKVGQIMVHDVRTVAPTDSLDAAASLMWQNDCGVIPVVDEQRKPVAMLTDRDICMHAWSTGRALADLPVSGAMSAGIIACRPDDTLERAENLMRIHQVRRLPVTDVHGRICGMLSLSDLSQEARLERDRSKKEVTDADVAMTLAAVSAPRVGGPLAPVSEMR